MDNGHIVIAGNDVSESREPLLHALDLDSIGERISKMLQLLLVRCYSRDESKKKKSNSHVVTLKKTWSVVVLAQEAHGGCLSHVNETH